MRGPLVCAYPELAYVKALPQGCSVSLAGDIPRDKSRKIYAALESML